MPFMKMLISNSLKTGTSVIPYTLLHQLLKEDPIIFLPSIPLRCFKDIVRSLWVIQSYALKGSKRIAKSHNYPRFYAKQSK